MTYNLIYNTYLCLAQEDDKNKYECKIFKNFLEADNYLLDNCNKNLKSLIIQKCRFYPKFLLKKTLKDYNSEKINVTFVEEFNKTFVEEFNKYI